MFEHLYSDELHEGTAKTMKLFCNVLACFTLFALKKMKKMFENLFSDQVHEGTIKNNETF